jgi:hypothetical protein
VWESWQYGYQVKPERAQVPDRDMEVVAYPRT